MSRLPLMGYIPPPPPAKSPMIAYNKGETLFGWPEALDHSKRTCPYCGTTGLRMARCESCGAPDRGNGKSQGMRDWGDIMKDEGVDGIRLGYDSSSLRLTMDFISEDEESAQIIAHKRIKSNGVVETDLNINGDSHN